ncbi:MAG: NAD-dependent epimerase/dehydratase family protein [Nanoarchaeota archaeon]|nr:NAD-dependent epimerase/dehydratase family protein [Nanoarchaeota archaeon]
MVDEKTNKYNKILVTGAAGFIGANLVRRLVKDGSNKVHIIVKKESNLWRIDPIKEKLTLHEVDLLDYSLLNNIVKEIKPDYIFHLATYGAYPRTQKDIKKIADTIYAGTVNLILVLNDVPYKLFVNTGTSSEYGKNDKPMNENDLPKPNIVYGAVKAGITLLCQTIADIYDKNICTLRLFSAYGPYEDKDRLIQYLMINCINGKALQVSEGNQARDFVYVDDIIDAYIATMKNPEKVKGQVINIGSGKQTKIKIVINKVVELTGFNSTIKWGERKMESFETDIWIADVQKAKALLNWSAKFDIQNGLEKNIEWFKKNKEIYD